MTSSTDRPEARGSLADIARVFLRLGFVAFGGPAVHIAMMEDEFVSRRKWIDRQHFLDLVGATNLIPGPNSTEMTMHLGYERGGRAGLVVAGSAFMLPAVLITAAFAWMYVRFGTLPDVEPFLYGIKPAVIAVIAGAVFKLGRKAVTGWRLAAIGVFVIAAVLTGLGEVQALLAGGVLGMFWLRSTNSGSARATDRRLALLFLQPARDSTAAVAGVAGAVAGGVAAVSLWKMFFFFLKIGAILYGSGYVLVAFLEGGLVEDFGWMTQTQLLDAVAVGQFTPGPILSTATFIGYVVSGLPGALVATLGIFLPSFLFVLILNPLIPRMRRSRWVSSFLDAVNVASVALMAAVCITLGLSTLTAWPASVIAAAAALAAIRFRINPAWIVLGGAVAGRLLWVWM